MIPTPEQTSQTDKGIGMQLLDDPVTGGKMEEEDENTVERTHWDSQREYILSTLGYCVGVGNLFRFPYVCNKNGGGAFLIPFLLSLTVMGLPLFVLEVTLGQFSGRNSYSVWAICPLFKGVGIGTVIVNVIVCWYYNAILAWAFYYIVSSFKNPLPWAVCDGWWNSPRCFSYSEPSNTTSLTSENTSSGLNNSSLAPNDTLFESERNVTGGQPVSSSEEFWQHNVLQISDGFGETGHVVWYMAVALFFAHFACFLALIKGIHSSGKVAYVTATAPYILVTILLIRGLTLPGAIDGIIYYIKPDFAKLLDTNVWVEAALQVFYSLGPGWGGLIVMASFNKFHNNCLRDAIMLTFMCEGSSIYGGFAIFSILGYMAHISGLPVGSVVSSGPGLAYIVYPEAISLLPLPQLWAILFFLMIITLCLDSLMTTAEAVLTTFTDLFPRVLTYRRRPFVTVAFCALCFVLGLCFTTQGGIYLYQLVDWYMGAIIALVVTLSETFVAGWFYGVRRFGEDISLMVGRRHPFIFTVLWKFVVPFLLLVLMVFTFMNYQPPTYGDYVYGTSAEIFGWGIALVSVIPVPVVAFYQIFRAKGSILQRILQTLRPEPSWGPADVRARKTYYKNGPHSAI